MSNLRRVNKNIENLNLSKILNIFLLNQLYQFFLDKHIRLIAI